jgi:putative endonuclease
MKNPAVYIMASKRHGTLYVGVTSHLLQRVHQHKNGEVAGFTKMYDCKILVYYEQHATMEEAIIREKQIKAGSRIKKISLINTINSTWKDLYQELY